MVSVPVVAPDNWMRDRSLSRSLLRAAALYERGRGSGERRRRLGFFFAAAAPNVTTTVTVADTHTKTEAEYATKFGAGQEGAAQSEAAIRGIDSGVSVGASAPRLCCRVR